LKSHIRTAHTEPPEGPARPLPRSGSTSAAGQSAEETKSPHRLGSEAWQAPTLYEQLGALKTARLIWGAMPLHTRWAFPYMFFAYRGMMDESRDIDDLRGLHLTRIALSRLFSILRPRFRRLVGPLHRLLSRNP